jgi:non-ribosomal peptide synthetase component E (peptide arylation enzyme)
MHNLPLACPGFGLSLAGGKVVLANTTRRRDLFALSSHRVTHIAVPALLIV